ncbi:hypothetical protein BJX96DRAFT_182060 [Aspergillus floccosus]
MKVKYIPHVTQAALAISVSHNDTTDIVGIFQPVLSSAAKIFLPTDINFTEVTPRWSTYESPSYLAAIKPATEQDVQAIVTTASSHDIPFLATGGGHGVKLGLGTVQNAVNIDLSNLKSIDLDLENELITIGSGVENSELYDLLASVGKETALTTERCINTVGPTLGGGLGVLYGLRGLLLDSLVSVRLVTASGDVVTASSSENPDLFWAIRGAGANFGIVTSATYRIYDQSNSGKRIMGNFVFSPASNRSLFELYQSMDEGIPPELQTGIGLGYDHTQHQPTIFAMMAFTGTAKAAQPYIDQFLALQPIEITIETVPWHNRDAPDPEYCQRGDHYSLYNIGLQRTDPPTLESYFNNVTEFSAANPWFDSMLMYERQSPSAVLAVPESRRGVYPWRDTKLNVNFLTKTPTSDYDTAMDAFIRPARDQFHKVMGYDTMHTYVNEAFGDEGPAAWYGEHNLPRLSMLKQKWDPSNKFGASAPVPLSV